MASDEKQKLPRGRSVRDYLVIGIPALAVLAAGFWVAFKFVEPPPPDRIVVAAGDKSGAYYAFAEQYRDILAQDGVELVIRETTGSVENIRLLDDEASGVDIGFVQGGTGNTEVSPRLTSLASLYYEPVWLFTRSTLFGANRLLGTNRLHSLADGRIAVGPEGSGTRAVAQLLLREVGLDDTDALSPLAGREAGDALKRGEIDAAFVVAGPKSPTVRDLISSPDLDLVSITLAEAMALRHRFLSLIRAPRGVIDPVRVRPPDDMTLLAPTAGLVVRDDFHPALIALLLRAAERVHRPGGVFEAPGEFPAGKYLDFPLHKEARRYLKSGPGFLQRYLPFWIANFLDRTKVMIVPLLTLLIPVFRILPPAYNWRMRSKIIRWYKDLVRLEMRLGASEPGTDLSAYGAELDRIETEVRGMEIPPGYLDSVYGLRLHINVVRGRLAERS